MRYAVIWVSPRGFANEGEYLFGEINAVKKDPAFLKAVYEVDGKTKTISTHKTISGSEYSAEEKFKAEKRGYRGRLHELQTSVRRVGE